MTKLIPLLVGVSLSIFVFIILANSHTMWFPGTEYTVDYWTEQSSTHDQMISLMDHIEPPMAYYDRRLSTAGYVLAIITIVLPGFLSGLLLHQRMEEQFQLD